MTPVSGSWSGTWIATIRIVKNCGTSLLLVCMTVACAGSAYAQAAASFAAVQPYSPANRARSEQFAVPENIFVEPEYRVLLESMLARSPSFRRQCLRIANEHALTVHVRHTPVRLPGGTRATTQISRPSGSRIVARVTLHPFDNAIEMIAHEFEHIVEQLDEVDLEQKARRARSGVHAVYGAGLAFETRRALLIGRRVVEELRQSAGQGS